MHKLCAAVSLCVRRPQLLMRPERPDCRQLTAETATAPRRRHGFSPTTRRTFGGQFTQRPRGQAARPADGGEARAAQGAGQAPQARQRPRHWRRARPRLSSPLVLQLTVFSVQSDRRRIRRRAGRADHPRRPPRRRPPPTERREHPEAGNGRRQDFHRRAQAQQRHARRRTRRHEGAPGGGGLQVPRGPEASTTASTATG